MNCLLWVWSGFNSLAPGRFQFSFRKVIFKLTLVNGDWGISYEIALKRMPEDLTDDKSTLVQVMAWCRQATRHNLSQCWPRSMSPNGVTRPQWVNFYHRTSVGIIVFAYCMFCNTSLGLARTEAPTKVMSDRLQRGHHETRAWQIILTT